MSEEAEILKLVCRRLEAAAIPYMITGSMAANLYAVPRMTRDIDVVIEAQSGDIPKMTELFKQDFYVDRESISEAIQRQGMFNIPHNESVVKIDFIIRKNSSYRELEFQRRRAVPFESERIWVVSPEDLILSKLFWAKDSLSEMQLKDVKNLLSAVKNLDNAYLAQWTQTLGLEEVYRKAVL